MSLKIRRKGMVKMQLQTIMFQCVLLRKVAIDLFVLASDFQIVSAAKEKSRLPI